GRLGKLDAGLFAAGTGAPGGTEEAAAIDRVRVAGRVVARTDAGGDLVALAVDGRRTGLGEHDEPDLDFGPVGARALGRLGDNQRVGGSLGQRGWRDPG